MPPEQPAFDSSSLHHVADDCRARLRTARPARASRSAIVDAPVLAGADWGAPRPRHRGRCIGKPDAVLRASQLRPRSLPQKPTVIYVWDAEAAGSVDIGCSLNRPQTLRKRELVKSTPFGLRSHFARDRGKNAGSFGEFGAGEPFPEEFVDLKSLERPIFPSFLLPPTLKRCSSILSVFAALVVATVVGVSAQDACIIGCVQQSLSPSTCTSYTDLACVCSNKAFQRASAACLNAKCTTADQQAALELQKQKCGSGGYPDTCLHTPSHYRCHVTTTL
ncbi:hypothetical protein EDB89DRAFT_2077365 [Lactarius sanguifluus]|nr:hypothetical protein EDB89DRAFT_2077365 [Lactarius sanguifluus]